MKEPCARIGEILKNFREKSGLKQMVVAKRSGISTSMLSQIERSLVSPSVNTLFSVCNAMGMDITDLFRMITHENPVYVYHDKDRTRQISNASIFETLIMRTVTPHFEEMFLMEINPGQELGLSGKGKDGAAMGYVFSGTVSLIMDDKKYSIKKNDSIYFPMLKAHVFQNNGKSTFKAIWCLVPTRKHYQNS